MTTYSVNCRIDIEAKSPVEAARQALEIHRDPNSTATVFDICDGQGNHTRVHLLGTGENRMGRVACGQPDLTETHKPTAAKIPHWEDDPDFASEDWRYEVANGDTRLGYREWVAQQRDAGKADP